MFSNINNFHTTHILNDIDLERLIMFSMFLALNFLNLRKSFLWIGTCSEWISMNAMATAINLFAKTSISVIIVVFLRWAFFLFEQTLLPNFPGCFLSLPLFNKTAPSWLINVKVWRVGKRVKWDPNMTLGLLWRNKGWGRCKNRLGRKLGPQSLRTPGLCLLGLCPGWTKTWLGHLSSIMPYFDFFFSPSLWPNTASSASRPYWLWSSWLWN